MYLFLKADFTALLKKNIILGGAFSDPVHQAAFQVVINGLNRENWGEPFEIVTDSFNVSYHNSLEARRGK